MWRTVVSHWSKMPQDENKRPKGYCFCWPILKTTSKWSHTWRQYDKMHAKRDIDRKNCGQCACEKHSLCNYTEAIYSALLWKKWTNALRKSDFQGDKEVETLQRLSSNTQAGKITIIWDWRFTASSRFQEWPPEAGRSSSQLEGRAGSWTLWTGESRGRWKAWRRSWVTWPVLEPVRQADSARPRPPLSRKSLFPLFPASWPGLPSSRAGEETSGERWGGLGLGRRWWGRSGEAGTSTGTSTAGLSQFPAEFPTSYLKVHTQQALLLQQWDRPS